MLLKVIVFNFKGLGCSQVQCHILNKERYVDEMCRIDLIKLDSCRVIGILLHFFHFCLYDFMLKGNRRLWIILECNGELC
jgi:hypothetical protein